MLSVIPSRGRGWGKIMGDFLSFLLVCSVIRICDSCQKGHNFLIILFLKGSLFHILFYLPPKHSVVVVLILPLLCGGGNSHSSAAESGPPVSLPGCLLRVRQRPHTPPWKGVLAPVRPAPLVHRLWLRPCEGKVPEWATWFLNKDTVLGQGLGIRRQDEDLAFSSPQALTLSVVLDL